MKRDANRLRADYRKVIRRPTGRWLMLIAMLSIAVCALVFAVRAYSRRTVVEPEPTLSPFTSASQSRGRSSNRLLGRIARQAAADRMRFKLGGRFLRPGHEVATLGGVLAVGNQRRPVRIERTHREDGEEVAVAFDGGPASLAWNAREGARAAGSPITGADRTLIERLALDSPDQFILAQLRGASYFTVAERVAPEEAGGSDEYSGPVWDVVRVGEPNVVSRHAPESAFRLYYINSSTGLIERVLSKEQGQTVVAEVSGWTEVNGERLPARTIWKIDSQVVMELIISDAAHGPLQ